MDSTQNGKTVLVMDDDEDVLFIADVMLRKLGFAVDFAESGQVAIDLWQKSLEQGKRYHAAILDINIPGQMGGKEALARIIEFDPDAVAFVSCGNPYDPVVENPQAFGFRGSIPKPFLTEHLQILLSC